MPSEALERKIASLPDRPGVYLWKGAQGEVLYVGKAKRLRQRVRNYYGADTSRGPTLRMLLRLIRDLDTIVVPSESQALLLENNLIKEYRPRFNIQLRDDKSYPRIAVTLGEPFPRVLVVRHLDLPGARFFGPYTDVGVLRRTLRIIRRLFTVRSCHYALPDEAPERPCLDYHIRRCLAPCVAYQSESEYRGMVDDVITFLEGKTVEVRTRLRERMDEASRRLDYERAAEIRDALAWLEQLEQPQTVEFVGGRDTDAIGFARDGDDAVGVVLRVRKGKILAREQRFYENLSEASDERGTNQRLVALADQNARHLLESFKIESLETHERVEDPVYALGRDLGLTAVPRSFVCIDISTNQGRDTVGSLVWFEAGRPRKSDYRRYKIREQEEHQDDYAAVHEVVTRFVSRRKEEDKPLPDLMVIDGGKGQLSAAHQALTEQGLEQLPLASLAKRDEEIFLVGRTKSLRLAARAPSLKLLQRARDEAHRFAVAYSRKRRAARTVTSELLNIPGVGEKRRRLLLERFGSLAGVRTATPEEIAALPGFSLKLADRILANVRRQ
jgi:excinuclease ABC subunit C